MKIKQEIIEATYSIENLDKKEYDLIKEGLRMFIYRDYKNGSDITPDGEEAQRLLGLME